MRWLITVVLTAGQRAVLVALIEARRRHHKTQHHELHLTTMAIVWRCRNGAKWRSLRAEFKPWWMAVQTFIRPWRLPEAAALKIGSAVC